MSAPEAYDDPVVINEGGITVGGVKIPGLIGKEVRVVANAGSINSHWEIGLTLLTGTAPVFGDHVHYDADTEVATVRYP